MNHLEGKGTRERLIRTSSLKGQGQVDFYQLSQSNNYNVAFINAP